MNTKELGNLAENIAARYLEKKGYEIIEKNYEKPWGEIDLVAKLPKSKVKGQMSKVENNDFVIVFVEVKANKTAFSGNFDPEVRIHPAKLNKIIKTARFYIDHEIGEDDIEWRIDVVSVIFNEYDKEALVRHYKDI